MRLSWSVGFLCLAILSACSGSPEQSSSRLKSASIVQLLPNERVEQYRAMLPKTENGTLDAALADGRAIFYDKTVMPAGYQDSMGDPVGMRPNSIDPSLIDTAVPGGHARLFQKHGVFHFPFGTGGMDDSTNGANFNFWIPPEVNGEILSVAYWQQSFTRIFWVFPVGTIIGEVLTVTFPDGSRHVFEVRTRERTLNGWRSDILRPFVKADALAQAIKSERPSWSADGKLYALVNHLEDSGSLTPKTLSTTFFPGTFPELNGALDILPEFSDVPLAKALLHQTTFRSTRGKVWKANGGQKAFAPTTNAAFGITANHYDGGMFEVSDEFCTRCHQDAGRQIGDFHDDLVAYGELWGEDQIFSWHPFEPSNFQDQSGSVVSFNDNNRVLRSSLVSSGLVQPYSDSESSSQYYKQLSHSWTYSPF